MCLLLLLLLLLLWLLLGHLHPRLLLEQLQCCLLHGCLLLPGNSMRDTCCEAARNGDCGAGHSGCVGKNWVSVWDTVCGKQDKARATRTCVVRTTRQVARTTRA